MSCQVCWSHFQALLKVTWILSTPVFKKFEFYERDHSYAGLENSHLIGGGEQKEKSVY